MDFQPTDLQRSVADLADRLLRDAAGEGRSIAALDTARWYDAALHQQFADSGLYGIGVPEALGGSGLGMREACSVLERIGAHGGRVPFLSNVVLAAMPLARFGRSARQSDVARRIASGSLCATAALDEPAMETPFGLATSAVRSGDGFLLSGIKTSVSAGMMADFVLVPARMEDGESGLFLVDVTSPGVARELQVSADGSPEALLTLDAVPVAGDMVLGGEAERASVLDWIVQRARVAVAACQLGAARRALGITAEWVNQREQFGRSLASSPMVALRAADVYIAIEALRLTMWHAADLLAADIPAPDEASSAKYWASEVGSLTAATTHLLQGGIGVVMESELPWLTLRQRHLEFQFGAARQQLAEMGARLAAA